LIGELGVGASTAATLQLGLALAALFGMVGGTLILTSAGLVWATRAEKETETVPVLKRAGSPA
jgi:hypothetical protein